MSTCIFCLLKQALSFKFVLLILDIASADNFHEVKRKRDKKKESAAQKDAVEFTGRPGSRGDSTRPGWSGIGRGASPFYHQSHGKGLHTISILSIFLAL